jgi:hypothetical protein
MGKDPLISYDKFGTNECVRLDDIEIGLIYGFIELLYICIFYKSDIKIEEFSNTMKNGKNSFLSKFKDKLNIIDKTGIIMTKPSLPEISMAQSRKNNNKNVNSISHYEQWEK